MAQMKKTMDAFLVALKTGVRYIAERDGRAGESGSPKASVSKTLGMVRSAAEDAGLAWPDTAQSSAKRLKTESEPEVEKIPSEHRLSLNCGSQESRVY